MNLTPLFLCVHMYVYVCICMYILYMYVLYNLYACRWICVYVHIYVKIHTVKMYVSEYVFCVYIYMYIYGDRCMLFSINSTWTFGSGGIVIINFLICAAFCIWEIVDDRLRVGSWWLTLIACRESQLDWRAHWLWRLLSAADGDKARHYSGDPKAR